MIDLASVLSATVLPDLGVVLPGSGRTVSIARFLRLEVRADSPIERTSSCWAPNKPAILLDGERTWAEFALVRLLERAGWEGRWIKNWTGGQEFCLDVDRTSPLPAVAATTFTRIHRQAAALRGAGAWDVFAWNGLDVLFIESKQHRSSDSLNPNQRAWLEAALEVGVSSSRFAVVEYDAGRPLQRPAPGFGGAL
jgi:hypothetical protein